MKRTSVFICAVTLGLGVCATGCEDKDSESSPVSPVSAEEAKEEVDELSEEVEEQNAGEGFIEEPDTQDDEPEPGVLTPSN